MFSFGGFHAVNFQNKNDVKPAKITTITFISARCNIYISRLCYDVSVCPSVCPSVYDGSALAHYS